ncbi:MAG: DUF2442 domain-containing protein [Rhodothermia bacterium]
MVVFADRRFFESQKWWKSTVKKSQRHGMSTLAIELEIPDAIDVNVSEDTLRVEFSGGRTISVPLDWYPRLTHATEKERSNWRIIGRGQGIHWEDIDEDISVEGLLAGNPSGESQSSFKKWLESR